jgi:hypothetical protein
LATREEKFKQAARAYFVYGVVYMVGAIYLASHGMGARGMRAGAGVMWFVLGALFIIVFPWMIARGDRGKGYLWFCRILTLLVAYRAFEVGRVALAPTILSVPLPGGGEVSMSLGAAVFFVITLATALMLARAAWGRSQWYP